MHLELALTVLLEDHLGARGPVASRDVTATGFFAGVGSRINTFVARDCLTLNTTDVSE